MDILHMADTAAYRSSSPYLLQHPYLLGDADGCLHCQKKGRRFKTMFHLQPTSSDDALLENIIYLKDRRLAEGDLSIVLPVYRVIDRYWPLYRRLCSGIYKDLAKDKREYENARQESFRVASDYWMTHRDLLEHTIFDAPPSPLDRS